MIENRGEIIGVNNFNGRKGDDPISGFLGPYCLISENVVWDAGVEIGMNKAAPDFRLTTGVDAVFQTLTLIGLFFRGKILIQGGSYAYT